MKTRSLTDDDKAMLMGPTLSSQFPVVFKKGGTYTQLQGRCSCCNQPIPDPWMKGKVTPFGDDMVEVKAFGLCLNCQLISPFQYRLYADMHFTGMTPDGKWASWSMKRPTTLAATLTGALMTAVKWLFFVPTKK